jgi:hypothetical protein
MMDIPPPLGGEFSSEEFPGTGTAQAGVAQTQAGDARTRRGGRGAARRTRSFRASALSARIARTGAFAPPHSVPVVSRAPSHATSGGA